MRKLMDFVNVLMTVLTGSYLVLLCLAATDGLKAVPSGLTASLGLRIFFGAIGLFLVWINIRALIKDYRTGGLRNNLRISTEQGMTEFTVPSMEMLILRDLQAEPDVVDPTVTLTPRGEGKPMLCEVTLKLLRQKDVVKRGDAIKRQVRDIFDQLIPGGLTVDVAVEVTLVSDADSRRGGGSAAPAAGEFNGPVYTNVTSSDGV